MMYDSSPPSIRAKMEISPVIKKVRTISRVVLAFSCAFFLSGRMRGIFPFLDVDMWVQ